MDQISSELTPRKASIFRSLRFQLVVALIFPLAATSLFVLIWQGKLLSASFGIQVALAELVIVSGLTTIILHRFYTMPGVYTSIYVLPVVSTFAAILFIGHDILAVPYSTVVYLVGFASLLATLYALHSLRARRARYLYCLVPGGRVAMLRDLPDFRHALLNTPHLPLNSPTALVADLHHDLGFAWERFLAEAAINGVPVFHYKQVWEQRTGKVRIDHLSENAFGSLVPTFIYLRVKRLVDLSGALAVLPLALPLLALIAIVIRLESPGPALFRQERMGYRGKPFTMIKFRTMRMAEEPESLESQKTLPEDGRITRVGRFLRKWRLDELPQIWNILRGEMSWIGPRPEAIWLSNQYEEHIPFYRYRHIVRPGITGWAQVNQGHVTSVDDVNTKLQLDFYYIKYFSYWIDLLITFRTIRVMILGFGAR